MNERARHDELTRLCREVRSLKEYQQQILGDVQVGLVEPAISELYAWWDYDAAALHRRSEGRGRPAKPRIDLNVIVTTNYRNQMQQRVWNKKPTGWMSNVRGMFGSSIWSLVVAL
jgi:hypothetical protein